ncbi:MAG: cell division protein FtsA [Bacilli bacterium]
MKRIYNSIDIGSDTIKIVVCELYKNKLNLLAATTTKSNGIKKGLITDIELARRSVKKALTEIEDMLGITITKVIANVPSYLSEFSMVNATILIDNEENVVSGNDVVKVIQETFKNYNDLSREMLTILPIDFKVDNQMTNDPKGFIGKELSTRGIMVTTPKKNIYSVVGLLESLGLEVVDVSLDSIGDLNTFKTKEMEKQAGVIVNIGSETTTISLFNKGIIVKNTIIQLGGKNIDNDIAYIYKIEIDMAKRLKEKIALAHKNYANNSEIVEITNKYNENVRISQSELSEIVYSRIEEILNLVKKEINGLANRSIDYIIVTGGTSNIPYFNNIAEQILGKNTIVGQIKLIGIRNNKYSACLGNIIYFIQKLRIKGNNYTMITKENVEILSSTRKNNMNETNIWKALIGFFDE